MNQSVCFPPNSLSSRLGTIRNSNCVRRRLFSWQQSKRASTSALSAQTVTNARKNGAEKGGRWCGAKHANIVSRAVVIRNEQSQGLEGKASVRAVRLWIVIHAGDKKIFYHSGLVGVISRRSDPRVGRAPILPRSHYLITRAALWIYSDVIVGWRNTTRKGTTCPSGTRPEEKIQGNQETSVTTLDTRFYFVRN